VNNTVMPDADRSDDLKFAYWVPNVSGGLVVSKIPQRTNWSLDYNIKLAQIAEAAGFDYALSQIRFIGSYGAEYQHESTTFSTALLAATERLKVIAAILPGPWHPAVVAKLGASSDQLFGGRWAVNVVSGWFQGSSRPSACLGSSMTPAIAARASSSRFSRESGPRTISASGASSTRSTISP
jgi:FMNH2-dependent dimethyl sulfone monooxygenase